MNMKKNPISRTLFYEGGVRTFRHLLARFAKEGGGRKGGTFRTRRIAHLQTREGGAKNLKAAPGTIKDKLSEQGRFARLQGKNLYLGKKSSPRRLAK